MAQTATLLKPQGTKAVVQWKGEAITISFQDVKGLICPLATDQEVAIFLKTCQSLQLNPFANECFLIKYDSREKAAFVIAIDSYLKAAEMNHEYDGCEAGIILKDGGGRLELKEGAFLLDEDRPRLVGGWAKVYRKDRARPTYVAVNKNECIKLTREGKPTQFWNEAKQPWMLRKSALKRALVEAFPSLFAGTLATAEVTSDIEGELPAAFQNGDNPDWPKFWVRVQNELGLTEVEAHALLGVESIKASLGNGRTLETIWEDLVKKVQESRMAEDYPAPMDKDFEPLFDDTTVETPIDKAWLSESLKALKDWNVAKYIRETFPGAKGKTVGEAIESLTPEQKAEFCKDVQKRLEAKGN
jgi:phage recombination protein Bet